MCVGIKATEQDTHVTVSDMRKQNSAGIIKLRDPIQLLDIKVMLNLLSLYSTARSGHYKGERKNIHHVNKNTLGSIILNKYLPLLTLGCNLWSVNVRLW